MTETREAKRKENKEKIEEIPTAKPKKTYSNEHIFVEIGSLQLLMCGIICGVKNLSLSLCKKSVFLFFSTPHLIHHLNRAQIKANSIDLILPPDETKKKQT